MGNEQASMIEKLYPMAVTLAERIGTEPTLYLPVDQDGKGYSSAFGIALRDAGINFERLDLTEDGRIRDGEGPGYKRIIDPSGSLARTAGSGKHRYLLLLDNGSHTGGVMTGAYVELLRTLEEIEASPDQTEILSAIVNDCAGISNVWVYPTFANQGHRHIGMKRTMRMLAPTQYEHHLDIPGSTGLVDSIYDSPLMKVPKVSLDDNLDDSHETRINGRVAAARVLGVLRM
ncbi:MAG: hypothetical protein ABIJ92_04775 [Candidatus Aenigmatarchaeota archaeon]